MFRIRTDFVSLSSIVEPHRKEIDRMKQHFGHHMPVGTKFKVMMNNYLFYELKLKNGKSFVFHFSFFDKATCIDSVYAYDIVNEAIIGNWPDWVHRE